MSDVIEPRYFNNLGVELYKDVDFEEVDSSIYVAHSSDDPIFSPIPINHILEIKDGKVVYTPRTPSKVELHSLNKKCREQAEYKGLLYKGYVTTNGVTELKEVPVYISSSLKVDLLALLELCKMNKGVLANPKKVKLSQGNWIDISNAEHIGMLLSLGGDYLSDVFAKEDKFHNLIDSTTDTVHMYEHISEVWKDYTRTIDLSMFNVPSADTTDSTDTSDTDTTDSTDDDIVVEPSKPVQRAIGIGVTIDNDDEPAPPTDIDETHTLDAEPLPLVADIDETIILDDEVHTTPKEVSNNEKV